MKKFIIFPVIGLLAICLLASCEKDPVFPAPTKKDYLIAGTWKFESGTYNGSAIPPAFIACVVDNTLSFTTTNTYTVSEGSVICSPSLATATPQIWSFQSGETQLVLASGLIPGTTSGIFTIVTLNATNLVLSQNVALPPSPTTGPLVITFKH